MRIISVFGAKHGVGTSTIAALLYANRPRTLLLTHDVEDTLALLGMQVPDAEGRTYINIDHEQYAPDAQLVLQFDPGASPRESHLRTARFSAAADLVIMDWGTEFPRLGAPVMVLDNSYLAVRRASRTPDPARIWRTICILDRTRSLGQRDIDAALGTICIFLDRDSSVQRASDAGILAMRAPRHTLDPLNQLMEDTPTCSFSSTP